MELEKALAEARQARDEAVKAGEREAAQRMTAESNASEAKRQSSLAVASAAEAQRQRRAAQANAAEAQQQRAEAERQRNIAQSRELAANSSLLAPDDPDLSLSLANEATRRARTSQAEDAVKQFMLETPMRAVLRGHSSPVLSAAYSPDGKFIVTASRDRTAWVWNSSTAQLVAELKGHSAWVLSAAYNPDGKFIVTASRDGTARVWNASTAQIVAELRGHSGFVNSAAYSPDGKFIVTASDDSTARIYPRVMFMPFDELME
jgi:hypothetical protein